MNVSVKARRVSEQNVPENLTSSAVRTVKIASSAGLGAQVVRSTGPFQNTGPIPPKAEQATTYTVIWTINNTSSSIGGAQVSSGLPPYVKWVGKVDNVDNYLQLFDTFVLTSIYEGFGLVLLEAANAGLPIVASNISAIPEVLGRSHKYLAIP